MKICPGCNKTFSDQDSFCDVCGGNLVPAETVVTIESEAAAQPEKKKGLLWWHILLIVLSILVVAGIVFAVIYFTGNDSDGNNSGENVSEEDEENSDDDENVGDKDVDESVTDKEDVTASDADKVPSEEESETAIAPEEESVSVPDNNNSSENTDSDKPSSNGNTNSNSGSNGNTNSNSGSGGNATDKPASSGVGDAKVDACINAFFAGKYYMSYYDSNEGESLEFAINGSNFQIGMEAEGLSMRIISLNGEMYIVNQKDKYINLEELSALMGEDSSFGADTFDVIIDKLDISKYNFKSSTKGTANVDGKNLSYEKYIADDAELYFYYTSGSLKRITLDADDDSADFDFEVDTFSATIPNNVMNLDVLTKTSVLEFAFDMMQ